MKTIPIRNSTRKIIVDDEDYSRVLALAWHYNSRYIVHTFNHSDKVKLHHFLIGRPLPPYQVDHINRDTFDNRKENLRIVTAAVNNRNRYLGGSGVKRTSNKKRWFAQIERDKKSIYLGVFDKKEDGIAVIQAYDAEHGY